MTETRTPAADAASATSTREGQSSSSCSGSRPCGSRKKDTWATCSMSASLKAGSPRVPRPHELLRQVEFPRPMVLLKAIAPRRERAQRGLRPGGRTDIRDGRKPATQHGREIEDSLAQAMAEPRRVFVAPVVHPFRPGPFV